MTSVMLATYPEVFRGRRGHRRTALRHRQQCARSAERHDAVAVAVRARELGDLVRKASNHKGPWPKLSVWHGSADRTVNPGNADEIVKQWLDVHGLPPAPMSAGDVDGYPREVWWNADGETVVESYTITDMAHGTPLGIADNDERYGVEGAFLIEAGISSSYHIANFFGLTERFSQPRKPAPKPVQAATAIAERQPHARRCRRLRRRHRGGDAGPARMSLRPSCGRAPAGREAEAQAAAPRHRCRRRHHPRADGRGLDEVD